MPNETSLSIISLLTMSFTKTHIESKPFAKLTVLRFSFDSIYVNSMFDSLIFSRISLKADFKTGIKTIEIIKTMIFLYNQN